MMSLRCGVTGEDRTHRQGDMALAAVGHGGVAKRPSDRNTDGSQ